MVAPRPSRGHDALRILPILKLVVASRAFRVGVPAERCPAWETGVPFPETPA
jgi:hypothetical protein